MNFKMIASVAALALTTSACMTNERMTMADDDTQIAYLEGAAMYSNKTIVENAVNSPFHTTLVAAVTAADLIDTLNSAGPFTVFAPTDDAFAAVPEAMMSAIMKPENKAMLQGALTYHVVPGRITAADLMAKISAGGGKATVTTVQGDALTFTMMGDMVMLTGKGGGTAHVTQANLMQSNGIIHVIDGVVLPGM